MAATVNHLLDTIVHIESGGVWEIEVPNDDYDVAVSIGDTYANAHTINVEGINFWSAQSLSANQYINLTQTVIVNDGRITVNQDSAANKAT